MEVGRPRRQWRWLGEGLGLRAEPLPKPYHGQVVGQVLVSGGLSLVPTGCNPS
jgi:hypothetical protein